MKKVLTVIPVKPTLHPEIRRMSAESAHAMVAANPDLELSIIFDTRSEPKHDTDHTPWSKVARVRNKVLDSIDLSKWDYLFWVDADVIRYPADMPTRLLTENPTGVSAPMVMIDGNMEGLVNTRFYDMAAFIIEGRDHIEPTVAIPFIPGRNVWYTPPYWPDEPTTDVVRMDCVGTITMVPAHIYKTARYEDHPAFTDHYPICKEARRQGLPVTAHRNITAFHANLPKYGEAWHG
jgi:hypothetical protein